MKGKTVRAKRLLTLGNWLLLPKNSADELRILKRFGSDQLNMGATLRAFYTLDRDERRYVLTTLRGFAWECPIAPVSNTGVKMVQAGLFGSGGVEYTNGKNEGGQA